MREPFRATGHRTSTKALLALLTCLFAGEVSSEIFKWVDAEGQVHYGDVEPRDRQSRTIQPVPAPPADEVLRSRSRLDGLRERREPGARRKAPQATEQAPGREAYARKIRCRDARRSLHVLELERPVYHLDEQGKRVYLEDDQRGAEMQRARKVIKADCP